MQGRRRQRAIQLPLVTVGLVFFAGTILFNMSPVLPKISELWAVSEYVAPPVMLLYCYNLGALFLLLALTPTQRRVVRFGVVVFLILAAFSIVTYVPGHVVPYARTVVLCTRARDADGAPSAPCDPNDVLHLAETSFVTLVFLIAIVLVLVNTFHVKKFPPPRAQLDWLWRAYATTQIAMGAIALAEDFRATLGSGRPRIAPFSFSVLMIVTGGAAATGRLREVVHTWLASRGEGIQSATVISVLLNGRSAEAALRLAQDSFRAITVDKVDVDGLSGRLPEADCFAESHPATLGSVDAFVCHSHHDSPEEKVAQLRAWAAEFSRTHGRAPRVWIDTHCLDSRDVEPSLACLPVFMAGCDRVLVLHGPTLPERLCAHTMRAHTTRADPAHHSLTHHHGGPWRPPPLPSLLASITPLPTHGMHGVQLVRDRALHPPHHRHRSRH